MNPERSTRHDGCSGRDGRAPRGDRPRGWHGRGYLPHFDGGADHPQGVTFRLADSVPASVVAGWRDELSARPLPERERELRKRIDAFLDTGWGACHLRDRRIGEMVENALLFFDGRRYRLHAWVVMPNHVHALLSPAEVSLSVIVGSWKSFTAKRANQLLGRVGTFWQEDYFDRYIRNEEHYARAAEYIEMNPVKAGLCPRPEDWPFGSARWATSGSAAVPAALRSRVGGGPSQGETPRAAGTAAVRRGNP